MTDRPYETPEAIQRDIERTRHDLGHKLDELQERLAPGEMMGEALHYVKHGGAQLGSGLARTVRENPIPVALIGAGIGWLLLSSGRSSGSRSRHHGRGWGDAGHDEDAPVYGTYPALPPAPGEPGWEDVNAETGRQGGGREWAERARDAGAEARHRALHAAEQARHRAESIGARARHGYSRARDEAGRLAEEARWRSIRAREAGSDFAQRNPLALGALGLLAGAVIGAMLPSSRQERQAMGRYREEALRAADEAAANALREGTERAVRAADKAAAAARDKVGEAGATSGTPGSGTSGTADAGTATSGPATSGAGLPREAAPTPRPGSGQAAASSGTGNGSMPPGMTPGLSAGLGQSGPGAQQAGSSGQTAQAAGAIRNPASGQN